MTSAQKEDLIRLHRLAAHWEQVYRDLVENDGSAMEVDAARNEWETAENDLSQYRELLGLLRAGQREPDGTDGM